MMSYDEKRQHENEKVIAMTARCRDFCASLTEVLRAGGHEVEVGTMSLNYWDRDKEGMSFDAPRKVDGELVSINFKAGMTKGYRSNYTGKLFMSIGDYGSKTNFPEAKSGFNVSKAATALLGHIEASRQRDRTRKANEASRANANAVRDGLNAALGAEPYSAHGVTVEPGYSGKVHIKVLVTEDEARAVVALLAQLRANA